MIIRRGKYFISRRVADRHLNNNKIYTFVGVLLYTDSYTYVDGFEHTGTTYFFTRKYTDYWVNGGFFFLQNMYSENNRTKIKSINRSWLMTCPSTTIRLCFEQPVSGDVERKRRRIWKKTISEKRSLNVSSSPDHYGYGDRNVIVRVRPAENGSRRDTESIE